MTIVAPSPTSGLDRVRASARRLWSLTRVELRLLVRNRMALFMAVAMPIGTALLFLSLDVADQAGVDAGASVILMVTSFAILFVVYYNLVATYAARREELVLKRLRTGELTDAEIIGGAATASTIVALAQIVVIGIATPLLFEMPMPVNPVLVIAGVLLGVLAWVPLAAASSVFTRNAEMAQLTTLPALLVCLFFSGLMVPLDVLPDPLAGVAELFPLTPVVDLVRMGLGGVASDGTTVDLGSSFGAALAPLGVLVAWTVIGAMLVRRYFRWEPRR